MSTTWNGSANSIAAASLLGVVWLFGNFSYSDLFAQEDPAASIQAAQEFPDGITPNDVYKRIDLLDRVVDYLLAETKTVAPEAPRLIESRLGPLHVYQMVLACAARMQEFDDLQGVLAVPTVSLKPKEYAPRDVRFAVDLMLESARRNAAKLKLAEPPDQENEFSGKTPTDVFGKAMTVYVKLSALCGHDEISSNDAYIQMERAAEDVRSILRQADEESRYRIDAPPSPKGLDTTDVFLKCMAIRRLLNEYRVAAGEAEVPLPKTGDGDQFAPQDVFFQTQIIISELNNLKLRTKTVSSTPLPVPVSRTKVPSDVHELTSLVEYLLQQVKTGKETQAIPRNSSSD